MANSDQIFDHQGIIKSIDNDTIYVNILSVAACAGCRANSICSVGEADYKVIEIKNTGQDVSIGESVNVQIKQSLGFRALFLGYVLPFLVMFSILATVFAFTKSDGLSGLLALASLIIYYSLLYSQRDKIKKRFSFSIQKLI
jgi:sigma-E factor negative regulatory protein RseC